MIRRPPRSTPIKSSAASDVYKRQVSTQSTGDIFAKMANIGIMDGAYFVGRVELLNWLNEFLQLDYKKIEQVCSGAAYCQLMDALYPGKVPLSKVNFNAKFDYEFTKNFQILQGVFEKCGIEKKIDVPVLTKGKFQDNLEFLQWMKRFFDMHYGGDPYDAAGRRKGSGGATGASK
eukprot:TRINITY_DN925_c0_g1_i1.p1 TRINITY_DN925_c0_g1~~TRINITY_DN925_c0_g1_i1.p1  ORF type:complete len:175 (+),score=44.40 TRINITY_DN925_c0_g1_i1:1-525(+)